MNAGLVMVTIIVVILGLVLNAHINRYDIVQERDSGVWVLDRFTGDVRYVAAPSPEDPPRQPASP